MRKRLIKTFMYPWWRLRRGLTVGVRGVVADVEGKVLLVRHSYVAGWHLPGGGVERGETVTTALKRELREEANVVLDSPPGLHGIFSNDEEFAGDHVAVFLADKWRQERQTIPGAEIIATGFFALDDLPQETTAGTRRRLAEIFGGAAKSERW